MSSLGPVFRPPGLSIFEISTCSSTHLLQSIEVMAHLPTSEILELYSGLEGNSQVIFGVITLGGEIVKGILRGFQLRQPAGYQIHSHCSVQLNGNAEESTAGEGNLRSLCPTDKCSSILGSLPQNPSR
jgi:hypothetical protein